MLASGDSHNHVKLDSLALAEPLSSPTKAEPREGDSQGRKRIRYSCNDHGNAFLQPLWQRGARFLVARIPGGACPLSSREHAIPSPRRGVLGGRTPLHRADRRQPSNQPPRCVGCRWLRGVHHQCKVASPHTRATETLRVGVCPSPLILRTHVAGHQPGR